MVNKKIEILYFLTILLIHGVLNSNNYKDTTFLLFYLFIKKIITIFASDSERNLAVLRIGACRGSLAPYCILNSNRNFPFSYSHTSFISYLKFLSSIRSLIFRNIKRSEAPLLLLMIIRGDCSVPFFIM